MKLPIYKQLLAASFWRLVLVFVIFAISYFLFSIAPVHAQTQNGQWSMVNGQSSPSPTVNPLNTNPDVEKNVHNGVQIIMLETMSAMVCQLTGYDPLTNNQRCLGVDPQTGKIGFVENGTGMIGVMSKLISYTFVPPASSMQYLAYLRNNFGLVKPSYAQAQGIGFESITPLLPLWAVMRNFAYLLFILIFVVIGLAIMLRVHIDPRTVMTIQNQIPKIIVGIVLVTFSFALAGFLIDVMYTASYLLGSVIYSANTPNQQDYHLIIRSGNPFDAASKAYSRGLLGIIDDGSSNFTNLINNIFFGNPQGVSSPDDPRVFQNKFGSIDFIGGIIRDLVGTLIHVIAFVIIAIAVIYTLIKLWIVLVFAYINILLDIIFAPFWFLLGLLPGSEVGIGGWFKDMIANLAVYPATVAMLMLANVFAHLIDRPVGDPLFIPPVLGNPLNAQAMSGLIALGFFFMLPNVLQIMKGALKAPKIDFGPVFAPAGEAFGTAGAVVSGGVTYGTSAIRYDKSGKPVSRGGFTAVARKVFGAG